MALKAPKIRYEIAHIILAGTPSELNNQMAEFVNDNWKLSSSDMIMFDGANKILQVFYVITREIKELDA